MDLFDLKLTLLAIAAFVLIGGGLASMILFIQSQLRSPEECKVQVNDDPSDSESFSEGTTLLEALTSMNIPVPSPCGGKGTCKQCKVRVDKGAGIPLETDRATFTKRQLAKGWRLSCQFKLKENVHVHIEPHSLAVKEWTGTVISNENVATFIKELIIELAPEEHIHYKAGAYLQFRIPPFIADTYDWKKTMDPKFHADWEKHHLFGKHIDFSDLPPNTIRAYSMASYPEEGRRLIFNVRIATPPFINKRVVETIPWGISSSYAFNLKPGDQVTLYGPFGEAYMVEDEREVIFILRGAGSAFGRSHIFHLFHSEKTKRKVALWYGARSLKESIYQKEYEKISEQFPNFSYHLVLSEPLPEDIEQGWPVRDPLKTNYVYKAFEMGQLKDMESPEECLYYVCGPPMHNRCTMKLLDDYGVPRENITLDDYGS